ncbi:uncharacterized protein LOC119827352 [Arvicola amphibius]|uniref:uncharacterized protein LOC119827352 n=1 Tax=Arvicola amphibius TaxID=1047088 RepID=UPI001C0A23DC|nr:uncharacterized protein LOC119827352 [Arvicola amphibius]
MSTCTHILPVLIQPVTFGSSVTIWHQLEQCVRKCAIQTELGKEKGREKEAESSLFKRKAGKNEKEGRRLKRNGLKVYGKLQKGDQVPGTQNSRIRFWEPVKAKYKPINYRAAGSQPAAQSLPSPRNSRSTGVLLHGKSLSKVNLMAVTRTLPVTVTERSTTISIAEQTGHTRDPALKRQQQKNPQGLMAATRVKGKSRSGVECGLPGMFICQHPVMEGEGAYREGLFIPADGYAVNHCWGEREGGVPQWCTHWEGGHAPVSQPLHAPVSSPNEPIGPPNIIINFLKHESRSGRIQKDEDCGEWDRDKAVTTCKQD